MWLEQTPIEEYDIQGTNVLVKREDLFSSYPAPALAKLRGARELLKKMKQDGVTSIAVFDTRISKAGQGIAAICQELNLECIVGFPKLTNVPIAESHNIAASIGAKLIPIKAGRTAVCYHQFAKLAKENYHAVVLPMGLVCAETVQEVSKIAHETVLNTKVRTIVLSTGTGTIASGIYTGVRELNMAIIGVSCGMSPIKQWNRIHQLCWPISVDSRFTIIEPKFEYYDALDTKSCPFPTSPYYDMKAWHWLCEHVERLEKPVLFWNIGV